MASSNQQGHIFFFQFSLNVLIIPSPIPDNRHEVFSPIPGIRHEVFSPIPGIKHEVLSPIPGIRHEALALVREGMQQSTVAG